jgi:hypothetical protein
MSMPWFEKNWMYAGFVAGLFLLAVAPLFVTAWPVAMFAVYLQLPVYMLHQLEEHYGDRFRQFANEHVAGGLNALTTPAVVFINVPGVWGIDLAAIYLAHFVHIGLGLIAVYLMLVNAVAHIMAGLVLRMYNPGLVTGVALFIPAGLWALFAVSAVPGVTMADHAIGLGIAILIHAGIIAYVRLRMHELTAVKAMA